MSLSLTVLGSAGTHPGPGRACSSYLVEAEGCRVLLDCGNGSLANLQQRVDVAAVDAVVLSHLHPDHFADLYGLYYARRFHPDGTKPVRVCAPAGAESLIGQLVGDDGMFGEVCRFETAAAGDTVAFGALRATFFAADHPVETLATRLETDDAVVAYSGDSGPTGTLAECARDADLFVCDATWLERAGPFPAGVHMTGLQAGRTAAEARARRLLVSHVLPTNDPVEVAAEAARSYDGETRAAQDLQAYQP